MMLKLSLLRLLRDRRRTLQQCAGVGVVCASLILWSTLTAGFSRTLYRVATKLVLGHIQLYHPSYLVSESLYDKLAFPREHQEALQQKGFHFSYRLYQYALASLDHAAKGVRIVGLDPKLEGETTDLPRHLAAGRFLEGPGEVVLGSQLAETLGAKLNAELVILGTAADGSMASDLLRVVGILRPVSQSTDQRSLYVTAEVFRTLFNFQEGIHELIVNAPSSVESPEKEPDTSWLKQQFPDATVQTWRQSRPQLARVLDLLSYTVYFTQGFIYIALGMLILNLKLMTVFDRSREYGVMLAIGLHPRQLIGLILGEAAGLAILASVFAVSVGLPVAFWVEHHGFNFSFLVDRLAYSGLVLEPILYGHLGWKQVVAPVLFMLLTLPLAAFYPALVASRIQPFASIQGKGSGL